MEFSKLKIWFVIGQRAMEFVQWLIVFSFFSLVFKIQIWKLFMLPVAYDLLERGLTGTVLFFMKKYGGQPYLEASCQVAAKIMHENLNDVTSEK